MFSRTADKEEDDYLNFLSLGYKIMWDNERIYFPFENGDLSVIHENQRVAKIKIRKLSVQYKDNLELMAQEILEDKKEAGQVRKIIKIMEKGV